MPVFLTLLFSCAFCVMGYVLSDSVCLPELNPTVLLTLCIVVYVMFGTCLICKFSFAGIGGIAAAVLTHFLFLRSSKRRQRFECWCVSTIGSWMSIYMVLTCLSGMGIG